ncbi:MAG: penicillin acylase family protein [Flavobacteriaceae bacterium]|nr:MAG: penicillin acylase family protein [Flavobacteriaceae bacterium]
MSILKKTFFFIVGLLIILALAGFFYAKTQKPIYEGNLELKNISSPSTVYFDEFGIPHIYAENQQDAMTTLGFVHAQDRLWQMELMRRISPGRLSEVFGTVMLKNDKFFKSLGIEEASKEAVKSIDKTGAPYKLAMAYLDGINQYITAGKTPIEFHILGVEKTPFVLEDVYNIFGYMAFSFAMAHQTDPVLTEIKNKLGMPYLKDLSIHVNPATELIHTTKNKSSNIAMALEVAEIMKRSPIPPFIGSNSWVIAPEKTSTGSVIFANDPHIAFSQPSVWYEAHIQTPDYEMYGYYLAGTPFPLLGHNREYAYGITMFENDDIDFYEEENHPTNKDLYKYKDGYKTYKTLEKIIKIKGETPLEYTVKLSDHGPIMNDVIDGIASENPIAMWWVFTKFPLKTMEAMYKISHAKSMNDVQEGASLIHAPGLNIMYGDAKNNVAWWATGKLYKQAPHVNRKFILNGSTGNDDPIEYLDFSKNPMAKNPNWNYVYSANNQPDSIAGMLYPGYYLPEDRAKRIVQLLDKKDTWDSKSTQQMITDVTSPVAIEIIKEFIAILDPADFNKKELQAIDMLKNWKGSNTINAIAPTIYNKWVYLYLKNTLSDELGEKTFQQILNTYVIKRSIAKLISNDSSIWWDDIHTKDKKESRKEILSKSLKQSVSFLENQLGSELNDWNWSKVHTLEHKHVLGEVAVFKKYFNVGPFPIDGAREVINNRGYDYDNSGIYTVKSGPSTRRVIDFSDIENSVSINPTGQSGNVFSKHYKDQYEMYNKGTFRKMKLNKEEIINHSTKLIFTPTNE